jgi:hypothetical protein
MYPFILGYFLVARVDEKTFARHASGHSHDAAISENYKGKAFREVVMLSSDVKRKGAQKTGSEDVNFFAPTVGYAGCRPPVFWPFFWCCDS